MDLTIHASLRADRQSRHVYWMLGIEIEPNRPIDHPPEDGEAQVLDVLIVIILEEMNQGRPADVGQDGFYLQNRKLGIGLLVRDPVGANG